MDKLWKFASNAESFELKDIEAALSEIQVILWLRGKCITLILRRYWRQSRHWRVSWRRLREKEPRPNEDDPDRCLVRKTRSAWSETASASTSPLSAESAPGFSSSASFSASSVGASATPQDSAASSTVAVRPVLVLPLTHKELKTSPSTSTLMTTMMLRRKNRL